MNNRILFVLLLLVFLSVNFAEKKKDYNAKFKVNPNQDITIKSISGLNVKVSSWDSNYVKVDLDVKISSSDESYEEAFIKHFGIREQKRESELILEFIEPEGNGWSLWDIFKLKFNFYVNKNISGKIFVPRENSLSADFKYSEIILKNLRGELELPGRNNNIILENCSNVRRIENDYGEIDMIGCKGNLLLNTRSSTLRMENFTGNLGISADYNNIFLDEIKGNVEIGSRSGESEIKNIHGDLEIEAPYSDIKIYNVDGFTKIKGRSESIIVDNTKGLFIDGLYCTMDISNVDDVTKKSIKITCRSGAISLTGINGNVNIDDQYSRINLESIKGNIDLTSRSETITGSNVDGNIDFETQYCNVRIEKLNAREVKMLNRSGEIRLNMTSNPSELKIKNEYGEVELSLLKSYEGEFDLNANYGKIITSLPLKIRENGSSEYGYGKIGNKNNKVEIETRSENIVINNKKE